jgi:hypothetical protein
VRLLTHTSGRLVYVLNDIRYRRSDFGMSLLLDRGHDTYTGFLGLRICPGSELFCLADPNPDKELVDSRTSARSFNRLPWYVLSQSLISHVMEHEIQVQGFG